MALLALTGGLGSLAEITQGSPDEPHGPIRIDGDGELRTNACGCVRNPGASGTASDPYLIEDWRIETSGGTAIEIRNIAQEHFVIRDNTLEGDKGVRLVNTGDRGNIVENLINFRTTGIALDDSSTWVSDNVVQGVFNDWWSSSTGVTIDGGSPQLDANYVSLANTGIRASSSSPVMEDNEIIAVGDAVELTASTEARLVENTVRLAERWGVRVSESAHARLISNEIREGQGGVVVDGAKLYMQDNDVTNQKADAIRFERATVTMFRNTISNNWRGAFGSMNSDVTIVNNIFEDNGDEAGPNNNAGLRLDGSEGLVENNTINGNDIGIRLSESIIELKDNELNDNRWGMSIPYNSKGSIPLMSGNVVNGVNVDGTIDPSHQRIFYEAVDESVNGKTIDSGHSNGHFGTLFKQGAIVIYDSQDMTLSGNEFRYNDVGIHIQGSTFVRVRDNTFVSNNKAVVTIDSRTFIKENVCEIEIDPPKTVCFEAKRGFTTVRSNVVSHVEVGVHFKAAASGVIENNQIHSTVKAGLQLEGNFEQTKDDVQVVDNTLEANAAGAIVLNFHGEFERNVIGNSSEAGVFVDHRTNATFTDNTIVFNGAGVVGRTDCQSDYRTKCSTSVFVENRIKHNAGVGIHLENGADLEGDVIVDNEIGAKIEGETRMIGVNASGNAKVGVRADGQLHLDGVNASENGKFGIRVVGELEAEDINASLNGHTGIAVEGRTHLETVIARNNSEDGAELTGSAHVEDGNFSGNAEAGLRLGGTLFVVEECEASFNTHGVIIVSGKVEIGDHPPIPQPPSVEIPDIPDLGGDDDGGDPLWMHECDIVGNADFAVKANVEARVNATHNFWGKKGPTVDTPLVPGDNVHSPNVRSSPYYETRDHEVLCTVPSTEANLGTPQGCLEP